MTDELIERVALAIGAAIVRTGGGRGRRAAWADEERSGEGNILAGVDGEIDLEELAKAALASSDRADLVRRVEELTAALKLALDVAESWIHDQLDGTSMLDSGLAELDPARATLKEQRP